VTLTKPLGVCPENHLGESLSVVNFTVAKKVVKPLNLWITL